MILEALWNFFISSWVADILDLIGDMVRVIPYPLLFLFGFVLVQALMACHASVGIGAGPATRALVHGAFLDRTGLSWSLGVPTGLVLWKWLAKRIHESRSRKR